ncbi:HNH endonuclease [Pseudorhodoferax sp. Leaf274]|uniref:HNH endonuclease n=1 Tax=Pseudorhodoferax sp. Leaf274 TaxID=1736318 RepID=UPI0009E9B558|nr:HNH endonuclease signature motif containing protein [Pseudorhodoferax sp. Leaf274]
MKVADKAKARKAVFKRAKGKCEYCGMQLSLATMTLDHYYPRHLGGGNNRANLKCACTDCNNRKGPMHPFHWEKAMELRA